MCLGLIQSAEGLNRTERLTPLWVREVSPAYCRLPWDFIINTGSSCLMALDLDLGSPWSSHTTLQIFNFAATIITWANSLQWENEWVNQSLPYWFCFPGEPWPIRQFTLQGPVRVPLVQATSVAWNLEGVNTSLEEKALDSWGGSRVAGEKLLLILSALLFPWEPLH